METGPSTPETQCLALRIMAAPSAPEMQCLASKRHGQKRSRSPKQRQCAQICKLCKEECRHGVCISCQVTHRLRTTVDVAVLKQKVSALMPSWESYGGGAEPILIVRNVDGEQVCHWLYYHVSVVCFAIVFWMLCVFCRSRGDCHTSVYRKQQVFNRTVAYTQREFVIDCILMV